MKPNHAPSLFRCCSFSIPRTSTSRNSHRISSVQINVLVLSKVTVPTHFRDYHSVSFISSVIFPTSAYLVHESFLGEGHQLWIVRSRVKAPLIPSKPVRCYLVEQHWRLLSPTDSFFLIFDHLFTFMILHH